MATITKLVAREILDSRGVPTIETTVFLDNGVFAIASVPSGPELGGHHAQELRDGDQNRFEGLGVQKAVSVVNTTIAPKVVGMTVTQQGQVDKTMIDLDGTPNKARLGANSMLGVSYAVCRAAALSLQMPLYAYLNRLAQPALPNTQLRMPTPIFDIINGGKHGAGNLDFQEFHVVPAAAKPYDVGLSIGTSVYAAVKKVLIARNATYSLGDEGGFAPNLYTNIDAVEALMQAIKKTPYRVGVDAFLSLDVAASHIKTADGYQIKDRPVALSAEDFVAYLKDLNQEYHLLLLEDPLSGDAWDEWKMLTETLGKSLLVIGDDLLASNINRLQKAIQMRACSAILVKPNQVGTISETFQLIQVARQAGFQIVISNRSGETNDDFIADLAVSVAAEYAKFGAPVRGERVAKYNRLLAIFTQLHGAAQATGRSTS